MLSHQHKKRRILKRRFTRKRLFEQLEPRRLLAVGGLPAWMSSEHWHYGWELSPGQAAQSVSPGPLQDGADQHHHEVVSDENGNPLFVERPEENTELAAEGGGGLQAALATLTDTFNLHSLPNANHTIYLDFNGHVTEDTTWNSSSGISSIVSPAYDPAGNGSNFSNGELTTIQNIWKRVAEDFSPFNVNVTTEDPGAAALRRTGGSDAQWGTRVVVTEDWDNCGCGGFAYLNSFNDFYDEPVFVFNSGEIGVSAASTHEVGHALGLSHDGTTSGQSYYGGHGSGETAWGPIMGSGYYTNMTTWDAGQYYQANNSQNDWQIITSNNGFGYRTDDHGASIAGATLLDDLGVNSSDPTLLDVAGFGIIELGSDLDWFEFETADGVVDFTIDSYVQETFISNGAGFTRSLEATAVGNQGSNLDIQARILDSNLSVVATSNPSSGLSASFNNLDLSAGTYYLQIDGIGYGDWTQSSPTGYDQSVSRGQYAISGTIVAAQQTLDARNDSGTTDVNTPIDINVLDNDVNPQGGTISITAVGSPTDGQVSETDGIITYRPNTEFSGSDSFTYTITNGIGETDTATVSITVLPLVPPILFVDDDQGDTFERFYTGALDDNALSYDSWEVDTNGLPSSSDLAAYSVVIWNTGEVYSGSDAGLSSAEQATLTTYLNSGGNLFAVGQDILYNGVSSTFQTDYLKVADYTNDVRGLTSFAGVSGSAISSGMNLSFDLPSDFSADWSDTLTAVAGAEGVFYRNTVNNNAQPFSTVSYSGSDFKVVFMAAPFEGISTSASDPNNQAAVMGKVIDFLLGGNQSPIAIDDSYTVGEDAVVTNGDVLIGDSDPDGDPLTVNSTPTANPANGSVSLASDGTFTYTPNPDFNGVDSFAYTITDGNGGQDTGTVSITVTAVVDIANDSATTNENTPVTTSVLNNDTFEGSPVITSTTDGANGTVTSNGSTTTYTPSANFDGTDSYMYTVTSGSVTETATVNVIVTPVNLPPTANDDSDTTDEDRAVTTNVLDNDTLEGSPVVTSTTDGANGTVTTDGTTTTYTPSANFNGNDSYTYTVSSGGVTKTATVSITVDPVNDAATFGGETSGSGAEDGGSITGDLDVDDAADGMTNPNFTIKTGEEPTRGTATINTTTGRWSYTPSADTNGGDSFTVSVTDNDGNVETQLISLTVTAVIDIADDSDTTNEDTPITTSVLANDTFEGTPVVTIKSGDGPEHGTVTVNTENTITYVPDPDFNGNDGYAYTVLSGGVTETATVTVTVTGLDDAADDTSATAEDAPVSDSVTGNDTFSGAVTYVFNDDASSGTVTDNGNGSYTYTPDPDFNGTDSFTYTATDINGDAEAQLVTVTVTPVDDAADDTNSTAVETPVSGSVVGNDTFSGTVIYVINDDAGNGMVSDEGNGNYVYTPNASFDGSDSFTYTATDVNGDIETQTVAITVTGPQTDLFYFSRKNSGTVGGWLLFENEDIVAFDGTDFRIFFDGSTQGVSALTLDAFTIEDSGDILMSFSGSGSITGGSLSFDDSDIVRYSPATDNWEMYFDGSDVGLTRNGEDVDAIGFAADGRLLISTSGTASVPGGVRASDEDIIAFSSTSTGSNTAGSWELYFDGGDVGLSTSSREDVDAISIGNDGTIYLSTTGSFSVTGLAGGDEDIAVFNPDSIGSSTSGTWSSLYFDGSSYGFSNDIGGLFIVDSPSPAASDPELSPIIASSILDGISVQSSSLLVGQSSSVGESASLLSQVVQRGRDAWFGENGLFVPNPIFWNAQDQDLIDAYYPSLLDLLANNESENDSLDCVFANWSS